MIEWKDVNKELPEKNGTVLINLKDDIGWITDTLTHIDYHYKKLVYFDNNDKCFRVEPVAQEDSGYGDLLLNNENNFTMKSGRFTDIDCEDGDIRDILRVITHWAYINEPEQKEGKHE